MSQQITGQITIKEQRLFLVDLHPRQWYEVLPETSLSIPLAGMWIPGVYRPDYEDGQVATFVLQCSTGFCGLLHGMTARMEVQA